MELQLVDTLNLVANVATLILGGVLIHFIRQQRQSNRRVEAAIAPKTGIEEYLQIAATVFDGQPIGIVVCDDDGHIKLVNKELERITGYTRSELIGKVVEILVPDEFKERHQHHRLIYLQNPTLRAMRGLQIRHKQGINKAAQIMINREAGMVIVAILAQERAST